MFAFYLGRKVGRPFVNWLAGDKEKVESYLTRLKGKERILLFLMFLFPVFPDDLLCSVAGIVPIKWKEFIVMQVISRTVAIFGTIFIFSGTFIQYEGWGLVIIITLTLVMVLAFVLSMKYADQINRTIDKWASKISKKK